MRSHRILATPSFRLLGLTVTLLITFLASSQTLADVYYKWREANGNWTYGAHPPPNVEAIEVKTSSVNARNAESNNTDVDSRPTPTLSEADAKRHALYCETAKANLEALSSDAEIHRRDENGQIVLVSEEEKMAERENSTRAVEQYCHPEAG